MRVVILNEQRAAPATVLRAARRTLRAAGAALAVGPGDVVLRFTSRDMIRRLNREWRAVDEATDVLSFPARYTDPAGRRTIGDIAVCWEVARRRAAAGRRAPAREAAALALHGLLHLLGYDHERDQGEMAAVERRLRRAIAPARRPRR